VENFSGGLDTVDDVCRLRGPKGTGTPRPQGSGVPGPREVQKLVRKRIAIGMSAFS